MELKGGTKGPMVTLSNNTQMKIISAVSVPLHAVSVPRVLDNVYTTMTL